MEDLPALLHVVGDDARVVLILVVERGDRFAHFRVVFALRPRPCGRTETARQDGSRLLSSPSAARIFRRGESSPVPSSADRWASSRRSTSCVRRRSRTCGVSASAAASDFASTSNSSGDRPWSMSRASACFGCDGFLVRTAGVSSSSRSLRLDRQPWEPPACAGPERARSGGIVNKSLIARLRRDCGEPCHNFTIAACMTHRGFQQRRAARLLC